jgi:hypothetical protein
MDRYFLNKIIYVCETKQIFHIYYSNIAFGADILHYMVTCVHKLINISAEKVMDSQNRKSLIEGLSKTLLSF